MIWRTQITKIQEKEWLVEHSAVIAGSQHDAPHQAVADAQFGWAGPVGAADTLDKSTTAQSRSKVVPNSSASMRAKS